MGFEKAKLKVESSSEITVLFNPSEYNLTDSANYTEKNIPGLDGPVSQYISGAATTLDLTLMFDTYKPPTLDNDKEGGEDVTRQTRKIMDLTKIKGNLHRPPLVEFIWGPLHFKGVVTNVKQSFTMFLSNGVPVRAKVDVTFKSILDINKSKKQSPFESPDRTKFRTIHTGDQLWNFAWEEYGDPGQWRVIADENGIMNPLSIKPGQVIKLPAL